MLMKGFWALYNLKVCVMPPVLPLDSAKVTEGLLFLAAKDVLADSET